MPGINTAAGLPAGVFFAIFVPGMGEVEVIFHLKTLETLFIYHFIIGFFSFFDVKHLHGIYPH